MLTLPAATSTDHHSTAAATSDEAEAEVEVRDIHALTTQLPSSTTTSANNDSSTQARRRELWETSSHRSWAPSEASSEGGGFTTMSREFNALVLAGSSLPPSATATTNAADGGVINLRRIGEEEMVETNPLAIVPDMNPVASPRTAAGVQANASDGGGSGGGGGVEEVSVHRVKKEEVESKISAWQTAKIAKINNRLKREDVVINGWESAQVEKATALLKKTERKLDEQRAKAMEKMQNDVAKARRKAEEKRASAEAKRGTKVARVLELAHLLRAVGKAPSRRSVF